MVKLECTQRMVVDEDMVGMEYHYPDSLQRFKLTEIRRCTYHFECGHWCTDNVFIDLIPINGIQLTLL